MHPDKVSSVHELKPADYPRCVAYCQWFQNNMEQNFGFIIFSYVNSQNQVVWNAEIFLLLNKGIYTLLKLACG